MSYAPSRLVDAGSYWQSNGGANLGIVGASSHNSGYHVGRDRLYGPNGLGDKDYSNLIDRDRAGLTDAASALDLGAGTLDLRGFTAWLFEQCKAQAPGTEQIREVIGSTDGVADLGWSCFFPDEVLPDYGDNSHLWHTHISYFRDTEYLDKVDLFARYFNPATEAPMVTITEVLDCGGRIRTLHGSVGTKLDGATVVWDQPITLPVLFYGFWNGRATYAVAGPDGELVGFADDQCNWSADDYTRLAPGLYRVE